MLTKEKLAEVHEALTRLESAERGVEVLLKEEIEQEFKGPRLNELRKIKTSIQGCTYDLKKLYR